MGRVKRVIQIDKDKCVECGECKTICSKINYPRLCSGCGKCVSVCPFDAITLVEKTIKNDTTNAGTLSTTNNNKIYKTMKKRNFGHAILALAIAATFGAIVMLLWNALLPDIFGITKINFWQALGLLALSRILFSGMGAGIMKHLHHHHHNSVQEKWMKMTSEQRKRFIETRKHFGFGRPSDFDMDEHKEANKTND